MFGATAVEAPSSTETGEAATTACSWVSIGVWDGTLIAPSGSSIDADWEIG